MCFLVRVLFSARHRRPCCAASVRKWPTAPRLASGCWSVVMSCRLVVPGMPGSGLRAPWQLAVSTGGSNSHLRWGDAQGWESESDGIGYDHVWYMLPSNTTKHPKLDLWLVIISWQAFWSFMFCHVSKPRYSSHICYFCRVIESTEIGFKKHGASTPPPHCWL